MLHVAVCRDTYRDLAPASAMGALDLARRQARWEAILADPAQIALVAEVDGALAGFGLAGPPGDPAYGDRGEVKYLYVGRDFARRGLGRRLLAAMAAALAERGYPALGLGVVVGNDPAIAFYEAQGGRRIGAYTDPGPMWRSDNLLYAWDDLTALAARGG
ncbi:GNAT family N-acetyltransferase [Inquilinus sp.]|uniref:GNAT family N-acetyltransferase n=1 Tax=Inquilinus sp. TaxID=1932117 RepID=UPI00378460A5